MLKLRIIDIPKLLRNAKGYLISHEKNENQHVICLITYIFMGLKHERKDKVPQMKW